MTILLFQIMPGVQSYVVFYRIVIDTDHLTNIVQDYSIGIGVNILLHQTDITSGLIVKNIGQ